MEQLATGAANASLAIISGGEARIVFHDAAGLAYATMGPTGAVVEQLPIQTEYSEPLLSLDARDQPHIVYNDLGNNGAALHTYRQGNSWAEPEPAFPGVNIVDSCGDTVYDAIEARDAAVSSSGFVHVISPTEFLWLGLWYSTNRSGQFEPSAWPVHSTSPAWKT
jgi:hypothetical protein